MNYMIVFLLFSSSLSALEMVPVKDNIQPTLFDYLQAHPLDRVPLSTRDKRKIALAPVVTTGFCYAGMRLLLPETRIVITGSSALWLGIIAGFATHLVYKKSNNQTLYDIERHLRALDPKKLTYVHTVLGIPYDRQQFDDLCFPPEKPNPFDQFPNVDKAINALYKTTDLFDDVKVRKTIGVLDEYATRLEQAEELAQGRNFTVCVGTAQDKDRAHSLTLPLITMLNFEKRAVTKVRKLFADRAPGWFKSNTPEAAPPE